MKLHKKGAAVVIMFIVIFIILGAGSYLYGLSQNPNYSGWAPFRGIGPGGMGSGSCTTSSDCSSGSICVSTRVCLRGSLGSCDCTGSTQGECKDYTGLPAEGKECSLQSRPCAVNENPLCCPGNICVNGKCEPPGGIYSTLSQCTSIKEI